LLEGEADLKEAVATVEAQLKPALYYLDKHNLVAPEDGHMVNLQVQPGISVTCFCGVAFTPTYPHFASERE
jgi:multidrug resistance efflux pump